MNPLLLWGGLFLVGYLANQQSAAFQADERKERKRLKRIATRRKQMVARTKGQALVATLVATKKLIEIVKAERRAAAQARDRLLWNTPGRDKAHELVVSLGRRLDDLYARKQRLYVDLNASQP
jgi:hypothetical protein